MRCDGGGGSSRIVQLHATLRCNLRCRHCYSTSGPAARERLGLGEARAALTWARGAGFDTVALSGGEPLLYRSVEEVLEHARSLGLRTTATTNGWPLAAPGRAERLAPLLDGVAISLDGPRDQHDAIRARDGSFDRALAAMAAAREAGLPFGVIHTITSSSWSTIPWLAETAVEHGARLLQLHPLEPAGRAVSELGHLTPSSLDLACAYLLAASAAEAYAGKLTIQLDLVTRAEALASPRALLATTPEAPPVVVADLPTVVVGADGAVMPLTYGTPPIGSVRGDDLDERFEAWEHGGWPVLRDACQEVFDDLVAGELPGVLPWHQAVGQRLATTRARAGTPSGMTAAR